MSLSEQYNSQVLESRIQSFWEEEAIYQYLSDSQDKVFSIDTPPATVSGKLHLGHVYSYSHADFIARYRRMQGDNVFYPMGYDDNGLPTERYVEKHFGIKARDMDRTEFIQQCLLASEQAEEEYKDLWKRIGLSIDWDYTYRTIDERSRRIAQYSFIDLYKQGLVYQQDAPIIWCPECQTAIAQAELNDLDRESEFIYLSFDLGDGEVLPVATTRPELLPACVAIFAHPSDERYQNLSGKSVKVPYFGQVVPIINDPLVEVDKGSGAVMCCTFGDVTDVAWWYSHNLPLVELISPDGTLTDAAGEFAGLTIINAKKKIINTLESAKQIISREPTKQSIRVHERCDTPVEYIITSQWFIRILDQRDSLLKTGEDILWHPQHMETRYKAWIENLKWDWCISRQRYFGVHFPLWYCKNCKEITLADESQLPVDPLVESPLHNCTHCGSDEFYPETDIFDTWMTSSMTPQIAGGWQDNSDLYEKVYPFSLRPQAHEIIRTWAFYTIYKSKNHYKKVPWEHIAISGWGIAAEGMGKVSKSRGGGPLPPHEMIKLYSADAVRYWCASTSLGKDSIISEEKIQVGDKLVKKIWNVARFAARFLTDYSLQNTPPTLTPADQWILSRLQRLIERVTFTFDNYEYATSKSEVEVFFWTEFTDNYIEMCKQRLYDINSNGSNGARYTLYHVLLAILKLFAPIMPFVTEDVYRNLFANIEGIRSIHRSAWPTPNYEFLNEQAEQIGTILVEIATFVRKYKSEHNLSLGTPLQKLIILTEDDHVLNTIPLATDDLKSITRAVRLNILQETPSDLQMQPLSGAVSVFVEH